MFYKMDFMKKYGDDEFQYRTYIVRDFDMSTNENGDIYYSIEFGNGEKTVIAKNQFDRVSIVVLPV